MFGYVITNADTLSKEQQERFRQCYCGLCRTLRRQFGAVGQMTLSFDMTFLAMVLNALYEPEEISGKERCLPHPFKKHTYIESTCFEYAADMNIALAYHKCMDNWIDDRSIPYRAMGGVLKKAYRKAEARHPEQCGVIEQCLDEIHRIEKSGCSQIDPPVNVTGRMLGVLFAFDPNDIWADTLREMGDGLGRFVYFMDAYDDLEKDIRHHRFNPLKTFHEDNGYEDMCKASLKMMIGDSTQAFEMLPIVKDADIIRNILYSGVWSRYAQIQNKRKEAHA